MKLVGLPPKSLARCFAPLDIKTLLRLIETENVLDNILEAALINLNHLRFTDYAWDSEDEVHYENNFNEF